MMTNSCYSYRVYNMYLGTDPTERFAKRPRKMSKIYRLSLKVTVPLANLVLPKIYKMESVMESFLCKIHMMEYPEHRITYRIVRFAYKITYKSAMAILRLDAPIRVAIMVALTGLDGCALIAIL